jgi:glycine cleavage system transcriptional repressor
VSSAATGLVAVTVVGHDRPGIIADVTGALAELGGNIEDSSMTLLRGHFAMTLVVSAPAEAAVVESRLAELVPDLSVSAGALTDTPDEAPAGRPYVVSVHGGDRAGIVAAVTRALADAGGNVTDLTTRLAGRLYVLVLDVELPDGCDADTLAARLRTVATGLGVDASLRPADPDVL